MEQIPEENIKKLCAALKNNSLEKDPDWYKLVLSQEMLRIYVDNEWANQDLFPQDSEATKKTHDDRDFIKSVTEGNIPLQCKDRIQQLAENIYNMQNIENIDLVVKQISQGNLTSRFAELDAGAHLYRRDIIFKYIKPQGKIGCDYDLEITMQQVIKCEVKHKIDTTELSIKTISRALSRAKKQVPENEPAILFIKIPQEWLSNISLGEIVYRSVVPFFKRTNYIGAIMFRWEVPDSGVAGKMNTVYRVERNPYYRFEDINEILDMFEADISNWVRIEDLLLKHLPLPSIIDRNKKVWSKYY